MAPQTARNKNEGMTIVRLPILAAARLKEMANDLGYSQPELLAKLMNVVYRKYIKQKEARQGK